MEELLPVSLTIPVPGFLECFGDGVLTMAMLLQHIPCAKPWGARSDPCFDLLAEGSQIFEAVKAGRLKHVHFAIPEETDRKSVV